MRCPADAEALYEATCFAADNNALEVRSLLRSGPTRIPQVDRAQKALFECPDLVRKASGIATSSTARRTRYSARARRAAFSRLDFGETVTLDRVLLLLAPAASGKSDRAAGPAYRAEGSEDLRNWITLPVRIEDGTLIADASAAGALRYVRLDPAPEAIATVQAIRSGKALASSVWRASNLFARYVPATAAWSATATLHEAARGSFLAVPIYGRHGNEGAIVGVRVDGKPAGCPDRAVSFASNVWEYQNCEADNNYTYYFPVTPAVAGKRLEVVLLSMQSRELKAELWVTAYPAPWVMRELILEES